MGTDSGATTAGYYSALNLLVGRVALMAALALVPSSVPAELVINEFLPDPSGSDGGREFVELINGGTVAVGIEGVRLQFANGAVGAEWSTRWLGEGGGLVPPGGRFLLVDRNWQGTAAGDAESYLGLQNGPDALRLLREGTVLDLVGYGSLTDPELFEGHPVAVVPGKSLSRRPDGRDTNDNRADFVAGDPTPGAANFEAYSLILSEVVFDPPYLARPGELLRANLTLRNNGTEHLPSGPCRLVWASGEVAAWWDGADFDEARTLSFVLRPVQRGLVPLVWEYGVPNETEILRIGLGSVQVGAADLRLNEIMAAPTQGQGEWIELRWIGDTPLDLSGHALRDEEGGWSPLPAVTLWPGSLVVLAADSTALVGWQWANQAAGGGFCFDDSGVSPVWSLARWPSLNNTAPDGRLHADRVYLANPAGQVIDAVAWGGLYQELPERGVSLERMTAEPVNPGAAHWTVSTDLAGSTPGCGNAVAGDDMPAMMALTVAPPVLDRAAGPTALHITFGLVAPEVSWEVRLFNLWGDGVRDFGGDGRGDGPRDLIWDGRDDRGIPVGAGAYLVWLETRTNAGLIQRREKFRAVVR